MTPDRTARRRLPLWLVAPALAFTLLVGCGSGQRVPRSYTSAVKQQFLKGCEASDPHRSGVGARTTTCQCVYAGLVSQVPFGEFRDENARQIDHPATLSAPFQAVIAKCTQ